MAAENVDVRWRQRNRLRMNSVTDMSKELRRRYLRELGLEVRGLQRKGLRETKQEQTSSES